jgi:thiol-disulfide isomerase/thioredoxin
MKRILRKISLNFFKDTASRILTATNLARSISCSKFRDDRIRQLKISLGIILLTLFLLISGCKPTEPEKPSTVSGIFQEHRGKWIIVNYWASWCKPCHVEIPELNEFYQKNKQVVLLGVSYDNYSSANELKHIIKKMNIQFPVLPTDPIADLGVTPPSALPATYVINPDGKIVATLYGMQTKEGLEEVVYEEVPSQ